MMIMMMMTKMTRTVRVSTPTVIFFFNVQTSLAALQLATQHVSVHIIDEDMDKDTCKKLVLGEAGADDEDGKNCIA